MMEHRELLEEICTFLQKGRAKNVAELVQQAVDEGISAEVILNDALLKGMGIIGEKFKNNEVYVPEVLIAARAMNQGTAILKPLLASDGVQAVGKVVLERCAAICMISAESGPMMMEGKAWRSSTWASMCRRKNLWRREGGACTDYRPVRTADDYDGGNEERGRRSGMRVSGIM